jgi:transposase-like protein
MELAGYAVDAVVLEGRSYREVARAHGVSKSWVGKLVGRYRAGGYEAIEPRSRAPKTIPHRTPDALEDEICALRTELAELGPDAGAAMIAYHLATRHEAVPSVSTIWRVAPGPPIDRLGEVRSSAKLADALVAHTQDSGDVGLPVEPSAGHGSKYRPARGTDL